MDNRDGRRIRDLSRQLWSQHVFWTRLFIISTAENLADASLVTARLLRNPKDFEKLLAPFLGRRAAGQFSALLTEHLTIGGDLVNAAKNGETERANQLRDRWYQNADEITDFLAGQNPCWKAHRWRAMLYTHLEMTEQEAALRLQKNYAADIRIFDDIENESLKMADYMACGLRK